MSVNFDSIMDEFINESEELLDRAEKAILTMEQEGFHQEQINVVFRAVHTIKGNSGLFELSRISSLSHTLENLLNMMRNKEIPLGMEQIDLVLTSLDRLRDMIRHISASNDYDISEIAASLNRVIERNQAATDAGGGAPVKVTTKTGSVPDNGGGASGVQPGKIPPVKVKLPVRYLNEAKSKGQFLTYIWKELMESPEGSLNGVVKSLGALFESSSLRMSGTSESVLPLKSDSPLSLPFYALLSGEETPDSLMGRLGLTGFQMKSLHAPQSGLIPTGKSSDGAGEVVSMPGGEFRRGGVKTSPGGERASLSRPSSGEVENGGRSEAGGPSGNGVSSAVEAGRTDPKGEERGDTHLRVPIKLIDSLINLAGETVIARNELLQRIGAQADATLEATGKRMSYLITRLQEGIMRTRLQELNTVFQKLPRIVRDAATSTGKKVELVVEGGEVELDKTLIEAIGDSIMHMIRNSVDHGLEPPEERVRIGKPESGLVKVKAQLRGGNVILTIQDDGRGLNLEKIRSSAVMKGLLTKEAASRMLSDEIAELIFLPGLSTATEVTKTSGRGVGMDVVRSNFKKVGGSVEITSDPGHGTILTGTLPQTLTIVTCLMVKSRGVLFALPQQNVMELILLDRTQVSEVEGHDVYDLRGHLLPLLNLGNVLDLSEEIEGGEAPPEESFAGAVGEEESAASESSSEEPGSRGSGGVREKSGKQRFTGIREDLFSEVRGGLRTVRGEEEVRATGAVRDGTYIVVVRSERHHFGLVIDAIVNLEEIVVKRLGEHFSELSFFSGAAILGDGESVLILDVPGIARFTNLQANMLEEEAEKDRRSREERLLRTGYLLFRVYGQQFGVKVDTIPRIERISEEDVGVFMGVEIIQYREEIVPVVRLEELYDFETRSREEGELYVVIFTIDGMKSGLVVTEIENVMDELPEIDHRRFGGDSIEGHTILKGEITLVLDAVDLLMRLQNTRFKEIMRHVRERQSKGRPVFEKVSREERAEKRDAIAMPEEREVREKTSSADGNLSSSSKERQGSKERGENSADSLDVQTVSIRQGINALQKELDKKSANGQ